MSGKGIIKGPWFKPIYTVILVLIVISLLAACGPSTPTSTVKPTSTIVRDGTPQGELTAALPGFGGESWLPWLDASFSHLRMMVYDMLIYWDHVNRTFIPGLAESWEVSPDGKTTTFHLRKGVQFEQGWGEFTSADVKFNWEMQASPESTGKTAIFRSVEKMETPDDYTIIVTFKQSYPTFYVDMSMGNSGVCQGFASKKYFETVGKDVAGQKPIGTGPYTLIEGELGNYYKFEALNEHWRVVPEFKYVTVRLIPEMSTLVAALKNHEVDLSQVSADQLTGLEASGLDVEVSPIGGSIMSIAMGGMVIPEDRRYDANIHNKDPWVDPKVRKAMAISIDRLAICKALLDGYADPAGVPMITAGIEQYQYPYDPEAAKQLLKEAGYENGFEFRVISSVHPSFAGAPRMMEALAGYWEQIGLKPKIVNVDYNTYYTSNILTCKTAGDVYPIPMNSIADQLAKAELFFIPDVAQVMYQDAASYAIYRDSPKYTFEERNALVDKLNQYFFEVNGPIPVFRNGYNYAWDGDKVLPFPHVDGARPLYLEYVRHVDPLNNFRLFDVWPGR